MLPPEEKCSPAARSTITRTSRILVERLEHEAKLIALVHLDDVERRPVEHDIGAFARRIDLDAEAVERCADADRKKSTRKNCSCGRSLRVGEPGLVGIFAGDKLAAQQLADRRFRDFR